MNHPRGRDRKPIHEIKERLTTDPKDDSFKEPVKRPLG
jgi:hypothetical protein